MKFQTKYFVYQTPLTLAAQRGNLDIIKILLSYDKIDANATSIFNCQLFE